MTAGRASVAGRPPWELADGGAGPAEGAGRSDPLLAGRLSALAGLTAIGSARCEGAGFARELLVDARDLQKHAADRLRMSADHTVAVLAGGTGSGKSALFNVLAGASISAVGVTRPVTTLPHACVWGIRGSGPLLEWLDVPRRYRHGQPSVLGERERALAGLVLIDLPDHDTVAAEASGLAVRLVHRADLMIWVLDPQKYADASVHSRFLEGLTGHCEVLAVVLNQSDLLSPAELRECAGDLRRLLDAEGLADARIVETSAITGAGVADLRGLLAEAVAARRAATARISADVDAITARFARYADAGGGDGPGGHGDRPGAGGPRGPAGRSPARPAVPAAVPADSAARLVDDLVGAAGVSAVADTVRTASQLRAAGFVGWPVARLAGGLSRRGLSRRGLSRRGLSRRGLSRRGLSRGSLSRGPAGRGPSGGRRSARGPARHGRAGELSAESAGVPAGPAGGHQGQVDNALTRLADDLSRPLPLPWSQTVRAAVRSRDSQIPAALGTVLTQALPVGRKVPRWWRLAEAGQRAVLGLAIAGIAWLAAIVVIGAGHADGAPGLLRDVWLLPWLACGVVALLAGGWLTAAASLRKVAGDAGRECAEFDRAARERIAGVARELVIGPAERELAEFGRFRDLLRAATGGAGPATQAAIGSLPGRYAQPGQYTQAGQYAQPGQYAQAGQYAQPGQYGLAAQCVQAAHHGEPVRAPGSG